MKVLRGSRQCVRRQLEGIYLFEGNLPILLGSSTRIGFLACFDILLYSVWSHLPALSVFNFCLTYNCCYVCLCLLSRYISCVLGCPYEGMISPSSVADVSFQPVYIYRIAGGFHGVQISQMTQNFVSKMTCQTFLACATIANLLKLIPGYGRLQLYIGV